YSLRYEAHARTLICPYKLRLPVPFFLYNAHLKSGATAITTTQKRISIARIGNPTNTVIGMPTKIIIKRIIKVIIVTII
ncbi:MAG: hypothetical protein U0K37_08885, partial [Acutalibacteraceae bacterium]|nr:hypothetical protein [Acutalibacteraceae bacterium]